MRIVLSAIGTERQITEMVALSLLLRFRNHVVTFCAPEKYRSWIMRVGFPLVSSGAHFEDLFQPELTSHQISALVRKVVSEVPVQFVSFRDASKEADLLVASGLQLAASSIAEVSKIPYVYVVDDPKILQEPDYLPGVPHATSLTGKISNVRARKQWNEVRAAVNSERQNTHLPPIEYLSNYLFRSGQLLLACDVSLNIPLPPASSLTGRWLLGEEKIFNAEEAESYKQLIQSGQISPGLMNAAETIELAAGLQLPN
jgi:hypothetical protein